MAWEQLTNPNLLLAEEEGREGSCFLSFYLPGDDKLVNLISRFIKTWLISYGLNIREPLSQVFCDGAISHVWWKLGNEINITYGNNMALSLYSGGSMVSMGAMVAIT